MCVWYDQWTPGDTTGTIIHIAACDTTDNSIIYFSHDTSATGTTGTVTLDSGASGSVDGITVNSVEVMSGAESFDTSLTVTATNVASNITAHTSSPDYSATSSGAVVTITSDDGDAADTFAVVSSATTIATTDTAMTSAGTVNNVLVHNPTTITAPSGVRSIAKGADNDLYIMNNATSTAGLYLHKSDDVGATWADISDDGGGNDMTTTYSGSSLQWGLALPLLTDNDMMFVLSSSSTTSPQFWLMDGTDDTFTPFETTASGSASSNLYKFKGTVDKTTGDLFITAGRQTNQLAFFRYDASANLWDGRLIMTDSSNSALGVIEFVGDTCICRDQTNGVLMVQFCTGDLNSEVMNHIITSSDDGKTWSDPQNKGAGLNADDVKFVTCPAIKLDINERWVMQFRNDDSQDINMITPFGQGGIIYKTISGVVKDNAGSTVSGATVTAFGDSGTLFGAGPRSGLINHGSCITDGSGNYKCGVVDLNGKAQRYFTTAIEGQVWSPAFRNRFEEFRWGVNSTGVTLDTANETCDWDAAAAGGGDVWLKIIDEIIDNNIPNLVMMMVRCKVTIDNLTQAASTDDAVLFIGLSDINSIGTSSDFLGLRLRVDNATNVWETVGGLGTAVSKAATNTFTTTPSTGDIYVQIIRKSVSDWEVELFSDSSFTTSVEKETMTNLSNTIGAQTNFVIGTHTVSNDHTVDGTIDWVEIDYWTTGQVFDITRRDDESATSDATDASFTVDVD